MTNARDFSLDAALDETADWDDDDQFVSGYADDRGPDAGPVHVGSLAGVDGAATHVDQCRSHDVDAAGGRRVYAAVRCADGTSDRRRSSTGHGLAACPRIRARR